MSAPNQILPKSAQLQDLKDRYQAKCTEINTFAKSHCINTDKHKFAHTLIAESNVVCNHSDVGMFACILLADSNSPVNTGLLREHNACTNIADHIPIYQLCDCLNQFCDVKIKYSEEVYKLFCKIKSHHSIFMGHPTNMSLFFKFVFGHEPSEETLIDFLTYIVANQSLHLDCCSEGDFTEIMKVVENWLEKKIIPDDYLVLKNQLIHAYKGIENISIIDQDGKSIIIMEKLLKHLGYTLGQELQAKLIKDVDWQTSFVFNDRMKINGVYTLKYTKEYLAHTIITIMTLLNFYDKKERQANAEKTN